MSSTLDEMPPQPWRWDDDGCCVVDARGEVVCRPERPGIIGWGVNRAIGHLLAAAPTMAAEIAQLKAKLADEHQDKASWTGDVCMCSICNEVAATRRAAPTEGSGT